MWWAWWKKRVLVHFPYILKKPETIKSYTCFCLFPFPLSGEEELFPELNINSFKLTVLDIYELKLRTVFEPIRNSINLINKNNVLSNPLISAITKYWGYDLLFPLSFSAFKVPNYFECLIVNLDFLIQFSFFVGQFSFFFFIFLLWFF